MQMFDSSQTLLPAEELKKQFEQEGKTKRILLVVIFERFLNRLSGRHFTGQSNHGLMWNWCNGLYFGIGN